MASSCNKEKHVRLRGADWAVVSVGLLIILITGVALTCWIVSGAYYDSREDLLRQTRLFASGINKERVKALEGTEADLKKPVYLRLKKQLAAARSNYPKCRFIYLLGRKPDGNLFFFVDSEPAGSKEEATAGQIFQEAPPEYHQIFASQKDLVNGPINDHRGSWLSALAPIHDPKTKGLYGLANQNDALNMVKNAIQFYRENGRQRFLEEVNKTNGEFHHGDLYAFVYDLTMTMLAHPVKPELVGRNLANEKDLGGGKKFRKEIHDLANSKGSGWVEYEYENPVNKAVEPKESYIELVDGMIVCAGAYKGSGGMLAALGMVLDADGWRRMLILSAIPPALLTLTLSAMFLFGVLWISRRAMQNSSSQVRMRWLEVYIVAVVGLSLTLFTAWILHKHEYQTHKDAFAQLAESQTNAVTEGLRDLRIAGLESLANFYESYNEVSSDAFNSYSAFLVKDQIVHAWGWIPVVSAAEREKFEETIRLNGLPDFKIWRMKNSDGNDLSDEKNFYYPIVNLAPIEGNNALLGWDVSSDPIRRAALDEAARLHLITATEPVALLQDPSSKNAMDIYRPIYEKNDPKKLRGFVMASLRQGTLLRSSIQDDSARMEFTLFHDGEEPQLLAASWEERKDHSSGFSLTRPFCAFGKVFGVTAHENASFKHQHPTQTGLLALLTGLCVTAAVAVSLSIILKRREQLERLVAERTFELRRSEEYLSATLLSIGDGVIATDAGGKITNINVVAERLTGWEKAEALGIPVESVLRIVKATTREEAVNPVYKSLQENKTVGLDNHTLLISRDGTEYHIADSCAPIRGEDGVVVGAVLVFRDVTEAYKKQAALRQSEERHRAMFEKNLAIQLLIDPHDGRIIDANPSACAFYGYSLEKMREMYMTEINTLPEESILTKMQAAHRSECSLFQFKHRRADGNIRDVEVRSSPIMVDGRDLLYSNIYDITEKYHAEEQLRESESLQRLLIESIDAGVIIVDAETHVIERMNSKCIEFFGSDAEEILGKVCHCLLCPAEKGRCPVTDYGQDVQGSERVLLKANGETLPILKSVRWIKINGKDKLLETFINITKLKNAENELREMNRQLEEATGRANEMAIQAKSASVAKSGFLANMSHEIRTPLNAILGFAQVLNRDPSLTPKQAEYVQTISRSGSHLLHLINDILDMSRIEAGRTVLNENMFSLHDLLDDLEMMFRSRTEAKGLQLLFERDSAVPRCINADDGKLRQILVNLIGNAVKFTNAGGVAVRVRVQPEPGKSQGGPKSLRLFFEVEDTGPGIPEEDTVKIFDAFQQTETGVRAGGTGLGLAISHEHVEMMGGKLTVSSSFGEGACFRFDVLITPAEDYVPPPKTPLRRVARLESSFKPCRVLVVDDVQNNRKLLCELLSPVGFEVEEASNGLEALEVFDKWTPHAVFMDFRMPVMDGREATRRIKSTEAGRNVPIIAVTASVFAEDKDQVMACGTDAYLRKPFRPEEIFDVLGKCLSLRYIYMDDPNALENNRNAKSVTLTPLTALPDELIQSMKDILAEGDMVRFMELIEQVKPIDAEAAQGLHSLASKYDYEKLNEWLDGRGLEHG
jgi:PAS domain S-box-containing protein